jgi:predicted metalloprotease
MTVHRADRGRTSTAIRGRRRHRTRAAAALSLLLVCALAVSGCSTTVTVGSASFALPSDAPNANVSIVGTADTPTDHIAANAISDIQGFWKAEMPAVFHEDYQPVSGGFYSIDPSTASQVPCLDSPKKLAGNAFYCPSKDVVVWDRNGLLTQMSQAFGKYAAAMVLAHEWGHAIQARTSYPGDQTILVESQADCYAGAFTAYAFAGHAPHFHIGVAELDRALAGYLTFADPIGADQDDPNAHGNGFDRVTAFQEGFDHDAAYCASSANFGPGRQFTELPFTRNDSPTGNQPFDTALTSATQDLERYWESVSGFTPLKGVTPISGGTTCDGRKITATVYYCADSNTIYYDADHGLSELYQKFGDYAVATMLATGYSFAARHAQGKSLAGDNGLLGAICYAGAYTGSVFNDPSQHLFGLSPGDLDEALQALLLGLNTQSFYGLADTTGFQRVNAFQVGVRQGFGNAPGQGCQRWA